MTNLKYVQRFLVLMMAAATMSFGMAQAKAAGTAESIFQQTALQSELQVPIAGIADNDERGAASNVVMDFYVGSGASITSLRWNINLTSYAGSYLSEMKLTFSDTLGNGVTFTPGNGDDFDGTMDYAGFQDLGELGQVFKVGADGMLRLEFHDGFKDLAFDEPEGMWNSGTLVFGVAQVPEPQSWAMLLGGLLWLSRAARARHP